ncbi:TPA: terminase family protein [Citrobacter freundii]|nr:terminase family protein [Citrobacter freundii]
MAQKYSDEIRAVARQLYLKKWTPQEIKEELKLPSVRIVYYWAEKFSWRDMLSEEGVEAALSRRIQLLTDRDKKTDLELRELDQLVGHHVKIMAQRAKREEKLQQLQSGNVTISSSGTLTDEGTKPERKGRKKKNDISHLTAESFAGWVSVLFGYQLTMRENLHQKIRNILKSRQLGATWYFAGEALEDAVLNGKPQVFLSASKRQAEVFRSYIVSIAQQYLGVELTGNPIRLSNGAELSFLGTNSNTAQSNSANVYLDEYFWVPKFSKLYEVASAMATHDQWRITCFSTPSSKAHDAYPFWTGDEWRRGRPERKNVEFPTDAELRDGGRLCPDEQWRFIVTIEDAVKAGFNLANIEKLRNRYSGPAFDMLFMCVFVDDKDAVFAFDQLMKCGTAPELWQDFKQDEARPFGNREVWGGYDPSRTTDNATFVIIAVPLYAVEKYRVLKKWTWTGLSFKFQAEQIKKIKEQYNLTYIGIDVTGIGAGVFDIVSAFAPREAVPIHYSVESKNRLVLKMIDVVGGNRIEWDREDKDIAASFMAIKRTTTASGNAMTFVATRSVETGHADSFWAIAHAMVNEPLNTEHKRKSRWIIG